MLFPPGSTAETGVDVMASLTDIQLLTVKTLLAFDATQGAIRSNLLECLPG